MPLRAADAPDRTGVMNPQRLRGLTFAVGAPVKPGVRLSGMRFSLTVMNRETMSRTLRISLRDEALYSLKTVSIRASLNVPPLISLFVALMAA